MEELKLNKEEIKAVEDSIKHWQEDVINMYNKGFKIKSTLSWVWVQDDCTVGRVKVDGSNCPLCELYYNTKTKACGECPYFKYYNYRCDETEFSNNTGIKERIGHWSKFVGDPYLETAINMRDALIKILG
jgi:hypothetical protein